MLAQRFLLLAAAFTSYALAQKPHIFMMVVDDFGYANVGFHRTPADDPQHEVQTPTMDALAKDGVILSRNYLFWYCSPSRSALQTGRNPIHVNVNNEDMMLYNPNEPTTGGYQGIPRNMTGIGVKLSEAGYETHFYGKWHVGAATPDHTPAGRGWQQHMIYFDGANDYWTSQSGSCPDGKKHQTPLTDLWLNNAPARGINNSWTCSQAKQPSSCVYEDTFFVNQTLSAIANRNPNKPFFEIWAPHNIHAPLQVPQAYADKFSFIKDPNRALYAAKVNFIDDQLATVVAALKAAGMWDNLLFVLTADNGGPIYDNGSAGANNWPLKGGKTSNHEGGVRGNGFVSGGLVPPARRGVVEEGLIGVEDWYATFCALAGVDPEDARAAAAGLPPIDSLDLWPLLSGQNATSPREEVVLGSAVGFPAISEGATMVQGLIRKDGYKLLIGPLGENVWTGPLYPNSTSNWDGTPLDCGTLQAPLCLFNVFEDPAEHSNVAAAHPDIVAAMAQRMEVLQGTVFSPQRGTPDAAACAASKNVWKGFVGPFAA